MKLLSITALAATLFCSSAFADTMHITFGGPSASPIKVTVQVGNGPVQQTTVVSSQQAIGGHGCNYDWVIVGEREAAKPTTQNHPNNRGCRPDQR